MKDENPLNRFIQAQNPIYDRVLQELKDGKKRSHWMWYIFPQVSGLGRSTTSRHYAIQNKAEGLAYLHHPVLGQRLKDCALILLELEGKSAHEIFSSPDDLKLKSSMTLFAEISEPGSVFEKILDRYFNGSRCQQTVRFLTRT